MTKYLPAGCKDVKINLSGAYRTTFTHLQEGDVVRLDRRTDAFAGVLIPTPTHSPARSFWATVTKVERGNRRVFITTDKGEMPGDFAHTSITRKERATETAERLELDARAREDAVRQAEETRIQDALAAHPTPVILPQIPFMCGSHAHKTQAERQECVTLSGIAADMEQRAQRRLAADASAVADMPLAEPADLAADLVRIGREGKIAEPITHALNVVGQLLDAASDADRAYYRLVYAELVSLRTRAVRVASNAAMRQADKRERELAAIYGAESVHDFEGGYSGMSCVRMVMRPDGTADACGEPVKSAIHDPQAYLAYAAALEGELAKLKDPARTASGRYVAGTGPVQAGDFVVPVGPAAYTAASLRVGAQVWHPDFRGTVWVVWVIRHQGPDTTVDLVVPGTGDSLRGVNPDELVRVTEENMAAYVASLAPAGQEAKVSSALAALKRVSERLTNGEVAQTKLLNAEGKVRNLLASAKQAQARYAGRGEEPDQRAWERARARVRALEEVLELLV